MPPAAHVTGIPPVRVHLLTVTIFNRIIQLKKENRRRFRKTMHLPLFLMQRQEAGIFRCLPLQVSGVHQLPRFFS